MRLNKILIIEDNAADRLVLRKILMEMDRLTVTDVGSVSAAVEKITHEVPDLILLDIHMPEQTGFDFLKKFNQQERQGIPVILVSSFDGTQDKYEGIRLGAVDFIDKPIVAEDVKVRVTVHLKIKKLMDDMKWASQKTNEGIKILYKELDKKNNKLKQLDHLKDEFIGNVSHELRTPLTIIRESVQQVVDGLHGDTTEKQQKYLTRSLINLDRLNSIIENLLDISKLEDGKLKILKESVDLIALAKEVCDNFLSQVQSKGLELRYHFQKEHINVYADKEKLIQVLMNLLSNALKFTDKGFIDLSINELDRYVACSVADSGKGILQEDLPKMFNKFEQVGRTHGPDKKGTGLGLSICKGIIELHQGHISVESEFHKGSTFTLTLPKYTAKEFFRENVKNALDAAIKNNASFSILVVTVNDFDIEKLVHQCLYRKQDILIKDEGIVYVILPETSKEYAQIVGKRIKEVVDASFKTKKSTNVNQFNLEIYSYPDNGSSQEELMDQLEKGTNK